MSLSVCLIVRDNEKVLSRCLNSIKDYADEIIIVDTGSIDDTKLVANRYTNKVFDYNSITNPESFFLDDKDFADLYKSKVEPTGQTCLGDFAAARNFSFSKATKDYVLWLDTDDIVENAQNISRILDQMTARKLDTAFITYNYAKDENDRVTCKLVRERIVRNRKELKWLSPIHEILTPIDQADFFDDICINHVGGQSRVQNRNYKVMIKNYGKEGFDDARAAYYTGTESLNIDREMSVQAFERCINLSGWPGERAAAHIILGKIAESADNKIKAHMHYSSAIIEDGAAPEGYFALARMAFERNDYLKCIEHSEKGFTRDNQMTPLAFNPLDRILYPHIYYSKSLIQVGRLRDAFQSCNAGLEVEPTNSKLLAISQELKPRITKLQYSSSYRGAIDSPSQDFPPEMLAIIYIELWKYLNDRNKTKAKLLLSECTPDILASDEVINLLKTREGCNG